MHFCRLRLAETAVVQLYVKELQLLHHISFIKDFFFLEHGEFSSAFVAGLYGKVRFTVFSVVLFSPRRRRVIMRGFGPFRSTFLKRASLACKNHQSTVLHTHNSLSTNRVRKHAVISDTFFYFFTFSLYFLFFYIFCL